MNEKVKVIFDCDVGHDDAIALMLAYAHENIDLLGVTAVAGNQTLDKTLRNTLNVVQHLGLDVPVYKGMAEPLIRQQFVAKEIHGESGLEGPTFGPLHIREQDEHAVNYIIRTLKESDDKITLVPTGPLTNIAMVLKFAPEVKGKIEKIVLMGGAYGLGNYTPAAEFNIYADPEAADIVFRSGVPIVMIGLDLTEQTLADMDIINRMEALGNKAGKLFGEMMRFTYNSQRLFGLDAGPVHDVNAMAYVVHPELFDVKEAYVEICLDKGNCYGRTVVDFTGIISKNCNALVGMKIDKDGFWDMLEANLKKLS